MGKLPTPAEYLEKVAGIEPMADDIYRYLNFNEMDEYRRQAS
jgi:aconitate hydratase 2/2-methylisocitrate dehydratase